MTQLENCDADQTVVAREAVVLGTDVEFETFQVRFLVTEYTAQQHQTTAEFRVHDEKVLHKMSVMLSRPTS